MHLLFGVNSGSGKRKTISWGEKKSDGKSTIKQVLHKNSSSLLQPQFFQVFFSQWWPASNISNKFWCVWARKRKMKITAWLISNNSASSFSWARQRRNAFECSFLLSYSHPPPLFFKKKKIIINEDDWIERNVWRRGDVFLPNSGGSLMTHAIQKGSEHWRSNLNKFFAFVSFPESRWQHPGNERRDGIIKTAWIFLYLWPEWPHTTKMDFI